jgi:hypothetical protein
MVAIIMRSSHFFGIYELKISLLKSKATVIPDIVNRKVKNGRLRGESKVYLIFFCLEVSNGLISPELSTMIRAAWAVQKGGFFVYMPQEKLIIQEYPGGPSCL